MDGIEGWVPALGPSGWQGGEVFSEVQRWNRIEVHSQMKTPCHVPFPARSKFFFPLFSDLWYNALKHFKDITMPSHSGWWWFCVGRLK